MAFSTILGTSAKLHGGQAGAASSLMDVWHVGLDIATWVWHDTCGLD